MPTTTKTTCKVELVEITELQCLHCKHVWRPKLAPTMCPKCKYIIDVPGARKRKNYIPRDVLIQVAARCQGKCVKCGAAEDLTIDHVVPFSRGGECTAENFQVLCRRCNQSKGAKLV